MGRRYSSFIHNNLDEINYSSFYLKNYFVEKNKAEKLNTAKGYGNNPIVEELNEHLEKKPDEEDVGGKEVIAEKTYKKNHGHTPVIVLLLIVVCFSFTFLALDFLSGGFFLKEFDNTLFASKNNIEEGKFYAVYSGKYDNMDSAIATVPLEQSKGGAGYVLKRGDEYYMLLAVFDNLSDAESVKQKQEKIGSYAEILEMNFPSVSLGGMSEKKREATKTALALPVKIYKNLYALSVTYSTKTKDDALKEALKSIRTDLLIKKEEYINNTKGNGGADESILVMFDSVKGVLDNIETEEYTAAELRYAYCAIINIRLNYVATDTE